MTTDDDRPRFTPAEIERRKRTVRRWTRIVLIAGAALAVGILLGGIFFSSDRSSTPDTPEQRRYEACAKVAEQNGLDPTTDAGREAIGRCMEILASP